MEDEENEAELPDTNGYEGPDESDVTSGCPCTETCCDNPDPESDPEHECDEECDSYCEEAQVSVCGSCGATCGCDV